MTTLVLIETVLLAALTVLVAGLLRAYGAVLRRLHELDGGASAGGPRQFDLLPVTSVGATPGPAPTAPTPAPAGTAAPAEFGPAHDVAGETLDGELVSARVVGVPHDTLLLFLSSGCASCEPFWSELARPDSVRLPRDTRLLVVPQSAADESPAELRTMAPPGVDVILSSDAWREYEVPGSPHVVYVDGAAGRVRGEGTGQSLRQVAEMLARSLGDATLLTGGPSPKPSRDLQQESEVDRELLAAGILPGDPRLYGEQP
jgi:hypothetical protein